MNVLRTTAEKPKTISSVEDIIDGDNLSINFQEYTEAAEDVFAVYKKDRDYGHLLNHLMGIIGDVEEDLGPVANPLIEKAHDDFLSGVSQLVVDHRDLFNDEQFDGILTAVRHIGESLLDEQTPHDPNQDPGIDIRSIAQSVQNETLRDHFRQRMINARFQIRTVFDEYRHQTAVDRSRVLLEYLRLILNSVREDWDALPEPDTDQVLSEIRSRCYSEYTDTAIYLQQQIEHANTNQEISPELYVELRTLFDRLYVPPKQIEDLRE